MRRTRMPDVRVIAATRMTKARFERDSYLADSLRRMAFDPRVEGAVAYRNRRGLAAVFNSYIVEENRDKILVFTHDDVRIDDYWLSVRLDESLASFDIVGVAGNRRLRRGQPSWAFTAPRRWDKADYLSGAVAHSIREGEAVSYYGKPKRKCKLLDGILIAAKASTLLAQGLRFDEQFDFHFYDLDFCRTAQMQGLTLGTWPIALTHASGGSFNSPEWKSAFKQYRSKWGD